MRRAEGADVAVSVVVPSYNYASWLGEALQSVLDQTWEDFELLVVEDGSGDDSLAVAAAFAARDRRVRVLRHPDGGNHGLPATLALGIARAGGRCLAFLEADDLWHPRCLALRMEALAQSGAGVVFNHIALLPMQEAAKSLWFKGYVGRVMREHAARAEAARAAGRAAYELRAAFLLENKIPTFSCAMARTDLLRAVSLCAPVPRWLDWWIWAQLAVRTSFAFVPRKLTRWRLHEASFHNRVRPGTYLREYRAMGHGLRGLLAGEYAGQRDRGAALLLRLPPWLRLAARMAVVMGECGPLRALRRIAGRLDMPGMSRRF